jgi:hypothetical protein
MTINLEELYTQHLAPLSASDRLKLIEMLTHGLSDLESDAEPHQRNLMELHGLGKEIWVGVDAQEYVNQLRDEWDHRP